MEILLADDDILDRELFMDALSLIGKDYHVSEAGNGEEALQFLADCPKLPQLIILDLNMPIKDGRSTLKEIKTNPWLRSIPVCIMSTSGADFDIRSAYDNGANLFLVKPLDFKQLLEMLTALLTLFNKYVTLPELKV